jgi:hypothetical protein
VEERLTGLLQRETQTWRDLQDAARRQRAHVAAGNVSGVNEETGRMESLIGVLDEHAEVRRRLLRELGGEPLCTLSELESRMGRMPGPPLVRARAELLRTARGVASELVVNRSLLRRSLEGGEAFFQAVLAHLGEALPRCGEATTPHEGGPSIFLDEAA